MPDLASALSSTVLFLFSEDAQVPLGTAFIVGYPVPGKTGAVVPLVVTAKHVIADRDTIVGRFTGKSGSQPVGVRYDLAGLRNTGDVWEHLDDGVDLVVFRTQHFEQADYQALPLDLVASKETLIAEDVKVTDRAVFPCLLVHFMGATRNYPVTRDGSVALIADEPVPLEYKVGCRHIRTNQPVLLIDATSIPGASGSPVFLWPGPRLKGNAFAIGGTRPWLLGIMHGFYPALPRELVGIQVSEAVPAFAENSGIAIVFPSWRLLEILQQGDVEKRILSLPAPSQ